MPSYTPAWVKADSNRFTLSENRDGKKQAILSPFSTNNLQADMRAYSALLYYLKKMVQIKRSYWFMCQMKLASYRMLAI